MLSLLEEPNRIFSPQVRRLRSGRQSERMRRRGDHRHFRPIQQDGQNRREAAVPEREAADVLRAAPSRRAFRILCQGQAGEPLLHGPEGGDRRLRGQLDGAGLRPGGANKLRQLQSRRQRS